MNKLNCESDVPVPKIRLGSPVYLERDVDVNLCLLDRSYTHDSEAKVTNNSLENLIACCGPC